MELLRTPDERFAGLAGYDFEPRYTTIAKEGVGLRIHAVDEGSGAPVLLLHGEPSWSYLYRRFVGPLAARGHRVLAPDLVGFGRSDKPARQEDYTYERHVAWMSAWLLANDLRDVTLFCQDWGGLIGLRLVAAFPERFARVVASNTGLPEGRGLTEGFEAWLEFSQSVPELPVGQIVQGGTQRELSEAERAAYDAPFPEERFKAGARVFPALVPVTPDHPSTAENKAAWQKLERFEKPFLTAFSDGDPITAGGERLLQARIPGAKGQPHVTIAGAGHFLQEDKPEELVDLIDRFAGRAWPRGKQGAEPGPCCSYS
jgi:haloalkane dehalogenase